MVFLVAIQVKAAWQWWKYVTSSVHGDKPILAVNLDETSVLLHYPGQKGLVWLPKTKAQIRKKLKPIQKISHGAKRQCLTHVAMITNVPEAQAMLPQILLGNEHVIPASAVTALQTAVHPSIKIWRRKSSWVNHEVMKEIAREISTALSPWKTTHRIILLLDCCPAHLDAGYVTILGNQGIGTVFVPAKLTWLLQPLDTHAFSAYKVAVANRYRRFLLKSESTQVKTEDCLRVIADTIPDQLHKKNWARAFDGNGFGGRHAAPETIRQSIWDSLEEDRDISILDTLPTLEQFECIFPAKREAPLTALLNLFRRDPRSAPPKVHKCVPPLAVEPLDANPWLGRLRSSSSLPKLPQPVSSKVVVVGGSSASSSSSAPWTPAHAKVQPNK